MKKPALYFIITLICISLLGIIAVQFLWIRNAIRVKEELFNRSVNDALGRVVDYLEMRESMKFIAQSRMNDSLLALIRNFNTDSIADLPVAREILNDQDGEETLIQNGYIITKAYTPVKVHRSTVKTRTRKSQEDFLRERERSRRMTDSLMDQLQSMTFQIDPVTMDIQFHWDERQMEKIDSIMRIQQNAFEERALSYQFEDVTDNDQGIFILREPSDITPPIPPLPRPDKESLLKARVDKLTGKAKMLKEVIQKMTIEMETRPDQIGERISIDTLNAFLQQSLAEKDIRMPFEFAVETSENDSIITSLRSAGFRDEFEDTEHRVSLFPSDLIRKPAQLLVYFPSQKNHVLKSVSWLMTGSILFTIIIVLSSAASIVVMIRQKKVSDIKTDFINNMTHEFKTPIATISIATDSINNPKVIHEPERIRDFTRIIKEENNRMNTRVEQVLQMALLDSRDFRLRPSDIDMNELIRRSAEHFRLQIEKREGSLLMELEASNPVVFADEDHMRNVLMNLLDNANKYSGSNPQIRVFSMNRGSRFLFGVEDKGMGMNPATRQKIFDKFFRFSTGNIHSIKGSGLGLSYVKAIVLAHQGEIQVFSEVGKGSRFEISLPVRRNEMND